MSSAIAIPTPYSKLQVRIAVSVFYFCQGISFMSWASRIPDFKSNLHLNEARLANILWALPVGQLLTMFFSGRAVTRWGSKNVIRIAFVGYVLVLCCIGMVSAPWQLALALFCFGVCGNMCNISVNTQGVLAEALYGRNIMASFHGAWSAAGCIGAAFGALMIKFKIPPNIHFTFVAIFGIIMLLIFNKFLLENTSNNPVSSLRNIKMPEILLIKLGIIGFCCLSCEGCMFDWNEVYFKQIVHARGAFVSLGLISFMIMMATGRFMGDGLAEKFGRKRMVQFSGIIIFTGMMTAVLFPYLWSATLGFLLVGFGVSSIVPLLYSTAGKSSALSSGIAIATVSSIGFLGFLMGPPLIGYIAQLAGLQYSFMVIAFLGLGISVMINRVREIN